MTAQNNKVRLIDLLEVDISIIKPRNTKMKRNSVGTGEFQILGACSAHVALKNPGGEPLVLFERLHGFIGVSKSDNSTQKRRVVNYDNSHKNTEGRTFPGSQPTKEFRDLLEGKTVEAFNVGYQSVSFEEQQAAAAGIEPGVFTDMSTTFFEKAQKLDKETSIRQSENIVGTNQLSKDIENSGTKE